MFDEETGLYYLRNRYYCVKRNRFINGDTFLGSTGKILSHNCLSYCDNTPTLFADPDGYGKVLSTDNLCEFGARDWGTHTTPLPVSTLIRVLTEIEHDGDWVYTSNSLKYKKIDCIGLILIGAKFHLTEDAFRNTYDIGLGTTSAIDHGNTVGGLKPFTGDTSVLVPGMIMYCKGKNGKRRGHVGVYVGYYVDRFGNELKHAVIHCQGPAGSPVIAEEIIGSRFSNKDAEYTSYNYLEYDVTYQMTLPAVEKARSCGKWGMVCLCEK